MRLCHGRTSRRSRVKRTWPSRAGASSVLDAAAGSPSLSLSAGRSRESISLCWPQPGVRPTTIQIPPVNSLPNLCRYWWRSMTGQMYGPVLRVTRSPGRGSRTKAARSSSASYKQVSLSLPLLLSYSPNLCWPWNINGPAACRNQVHCQDMTARKLARRPLDEPVLLFARASHARLSSAVHGMRVAFSSFGM